jgi:hypothetical protein
MPSNVVDVLAVAAMYVKEANPAGAVDLPFDVSPASPALSVEMMTPGGTTDKFSVVNAGTQWLLPNAHTLVCPASFSGMLARAVFYYTHNLALSHEFSDYAEVLDPEFTDDNQWGGTISKILAVTEVSNFLQGVQSDDNTSLPALGADGVTDDLVEKAKNAVAQWSVDTPYVKSDFPLAGLPFVLRGLQTSNESAERVFPFDPSAARRLLLSLGNAVKSKDELGKLVQVATDYRSRKGVGKPTVLELTPLQKSQFEFFLKLVRAYAPVPNQVFNTNNIGSAKIAATTAIQKTNAASVQTVETVAKQIETTLHLNERPPM